MELSRRDFLKLAGAIGAGAVIGAYKLEIAEALERAISGDVKLVWLQGQGCTADSISLLQGVHPDLVDAVTKLRVSVAFHPNLMAAAGDEATAALETAPDVLVVEGAIPEDLHSGFAEVGGIPFRTLVERLAKETKIAVVAAGNCASFGGFPASRNIKKLYGLTPSPTNASGLQFKYKEKGGILGANFKSKAGLPVINIPGCPTHPDWLLLTLASAIHGVIPELDQWQRPLPFFQPLVHDQCALRGFFDKGIFSDYLSDKPEEGCLYKLGCRGPYTYCDDSIRKWNNKTNVCRNAGAPCIGCMEPDFWDEFSPFYEQMEDLPLLMGISASSAGKAAIVAAGAGIAAHAIRRGITKEAEEKEG
jgi:hydrogenase small subunit